jgi:hypothetical protein
MTSLAAHLRIQPVGREMMKIRQEGIPFDIPLGIPVVNPLAGKRMLFKMQYRIPEVSLEDACRGLIFADYRSFMDIKKETYSRGKRSRYLLFNPFTKELEKTGQALGELGADSGRTFAALMVAVLGLIEWEMSVDPTSGPDSASIHVKVSNRMFSGHFKIRVLRKPDGVILEDDWCPEAGDMRTGTLAMANLVLITHPKGFEQIAERIAEEVSRARSRGYEYAGEIGPPSENLDHQPLAVH